MNLFKKLPSMLKKVISLFLALTMIMSMASSLTAVAGEGPSTNISQGESVSQGSSNNSSFAFTNATQSLALLVDGVFNNPDAYINANGAGYLQVDLGTKCELDYIQLYRFWSDARTYRATVVVVSDTEAGFSNPNTRTVLFNSCTDQGSTNAFGDVHGFGVGTDAAYAENSAGKRFDCPTGTSARYVRVYANGNTVNAYGTHTVELMVFGWAPPADKSALQTLYNNVKDTVNESYFINYWNNFQQALVNAKEILDNANVKQNVIDSAYDNLNLAYTTLPTPFMPIIPKPVSVNYGEGLFTLNASSKIFVDSDDLAKATGVAEYLAGKLRPSTGFALPVVASGTPGAADIVLKTIPTTALLAADVDYAKARGIDAYAAEGYVLKADASGCILTAYEPEGLFRGIQTIRQLLPAEIENTSVVSGVNWGFRNINVVDYPRYGYRSIALDVARKYFTKEEIMRQIDLMAQYKLNTVHMHLSDDQGFRIAFDGYPELTQFSGQTKLTYASTYTTRNIVPSGGNNSGNALNRLAPGSIYYGVTPNIYSKADFQEILDYAEARFVTIVPEIEIPTHAYSQKLGLPLLNGVVAPLGQMPNASLTGTSAFWTETVGQSVSADPTGTSFYSKYTAAYIQDIYTQLCEMLPERSKYIHLGGDEPNNSALTATIYNNMQKFAYEVVHAAGKKTMQWNASRQNATSLPTLDVLQNWDTNTNGSGATPTITNNPNAKVVMSLAHQVYIDHRSSTAMPTGGSWANGTMAVSTMFNVEPENAVAAAYRNQGYVIGVDAPCWSETYGTRQSMDILVWPRAMCIAEVSWSPAETRSGTGVGSAWSNFQPRMAAQGMRMTYEDIFFCNETAVWPSKSVSISSTITGTNTWDSPGVTTPMNTPVSGKFTFTTDAPDTVVIKKCSEPSQGAVTLDKDGNWTYTPAPGFIGKDSFTVGFLVEGYGMPMGPATSSNRGTVTYNGLRSVYINVTGSGSHSVEVTTLASSATNVRVKLDPPVPSLINTNFGIDNDVTIRMAETFDNGSTYFLVTTPRHDGNATYTLTVSKPGSDPEYTFNTVSLNYVNLNPKPVSFTLDSASFIIKPETKLLVQASNAADLDDVKDMAEYLGSKMRLSTGFALPVIDSGTAGIRDITLKTIAKTESLTEEINYAVAGDGGYYIDINVDGAFVTAYTQKGLYRAIQAILQLLPADIEKESLATGVDWVMTYAKIADYPQSTAINLYESENKITADFFLVNDVESDIELLYILTVYNDGGTLANVASGEIKVADLESCTLSLPFSAGQTAKAFVWYKGSFIPLCDAVVYE